MTCTKSVRFRPARDTDAERLKEIGVRGWETTYSSFVSKENREAYLSGAFWSLEALCEVIESNDAINIVAEQCGLVTGFVTTERLDDGRYEVTRLYVDPQARSKGVGRQLLEAVFREIQAFGGSEVLVNVFGDNHPGRRFYERHGFKLIEDTWTTVGDQRLSDVWYSRKL